MADPLARSDRAPLARHALPLFVVLAYACSWWTVPLLGAPLGVGVTVAAVLVLALTDGRSGVLALARRIVQWRIGWANAGIAVLLPAAISLTAVGAAVALGADLEVAAALARAPEVPVTLVALLVLPVFGPWEEPGFRGFAFSYARARWSPLLAIAIVGVVHVGWHLPLFWTGDIPPSDVVLILAASVVLAWLVLASEGSVLAPMLMHASNNAVSGEYASTLLAGADLAVYGWVQALEWGAVAVFLVLTSPRLRAGWADVPPNGARATPLVASSE